MLTLLLTVLTLIVVYFLQQGHPLIAGIVTVAPVKIVATSPMVSRSLRQDHGLTTHLPWKVAIRLLLPSWRDTR